LTQLGGPTRSWFLAMCEADGVALRWAQSNSEIRVCTTVIDRSEGSATELVEEARPVGPGTAERVLAEYEAALSEFDALIFSGTKAAGFPDDMFPRMVRLAAQAGKPVFLDMKGKDLAACLPLRPLVAKPNLEELLQSLAPERGEALRSGKGEDEGALRDFVASTGREYAERYGTKLVVTRGPRPTWFWDGQGIRECQTKRVDALNPIGSGDSFMAGLAAALMDGESLDEAVAEGTRLGALNAQRLKPGAIL
jgi:fructose-1-phosphate kinase PfkB-like protein